MSRNKLLDRKEYRYRLISSLKETDWPGKAMNPLIVHERGWQNWLFGGPENLGLSGNQLEDLKLLALLHDLGR